MRQNPVSFGDHFSQARMFWLSMTEVERVHIWGRADLLMSGQLPAD